VADSDNRVLALAAQIVSAHVANNTVNTGDVPRLIESVVRSLHLAQLQGARPPKPEPAVPVQQSVSQEWIACLECGKHFRTLKRHLARVHGASEADYRARWELPATYKMSAPAYAKLRADVAYRIGLGRTGRHGGWKKTARKGAKS
jgi:predicted transcriptional regulator